MEYNANENGAVKTMDKPKYIKWLVEENGIVRNYSGTLFCYRIDYNNDNEILDDWALHIRRHYVPDEELMEDAEIEGLSIEDYLRQFVIPQESDAMGSTARSGTIAEILFSDLVEFILGYHVPRCRQYNMSGKTVSEHGTDVIGYKFANENKKPNVKDEILAVEIKAGLSSSDVSVINRAVADSAKDEYRVSLSLNYMRKKLAKMGKIDESNDIRRFQQKTKQGFDYVIKYSAGGITSLPLLHGETENGVIIEVIPGVNGTDIAFKKGEAIYFIHGEKLMELAHKVYERCVR